MYWVFMLLTELKSNWEIVGSIKKTLKNKYKIQVGAQKYGHKNQRRDRSIIFRKLIL